MPKPSYSDEIDTAILNLKDWNEAEELEFDEMGRRFELRGSE